MRYFVLLLALVTGFAHGSDYAREKKWADEITPGIVAGDPLYLEAVGHKFLGIYTEASGAKKAVIVVHGIGVHPDWNMIGILRTSLAEQGYTTLSIQMPVLAVDAKPKQYGPTLGEADARLKAAVDFLQAKGYRKLAIVSHSMGSRMSRHYLSGHPDSPISAWVAIGIPGGDDFKGINIPVLDLYGENDLPEIVASAKQRAATLKAKGSVQTRVPKADHFFSNRETELVKLTKDYLDKTLGD